MSKSKRPTKPPAPAAPVQHNARGAGRPANPDKRLLKMAIALTPDQDAYVAAQAHKHGLKKAVAVRVMVEQVLQGALGDAGEALFEQAAERA